MNKIYKLLTITIVLTLSNTLIAQEVSTEWKTIESKKYSIEVPKAWDDNMLGDVGVSFVAMAPLDRDNDPFRENLTLVIDNTFKTGSDLKTYAVDASNQLLESLDEAHVSTSESKTSKNGSYYLVIFSAKQSGATLRFSQYYFEGDNAVYIITIAGEYKYYPKYEADFKKIADSFSLK